MTVQKPGRGRKQCPSCEKYVGSRAHTCECGHNFKSVREDNTLDIDEDEIDVVEPCIGKLKLKDHLAYLKKAGFNHQILTEPPEKAKGAKNLTPFNHNYWFDSGRRQEVDTIVILEGNGGYEGMYYAWDFKDGKLIGHGAWE